MNMLNGWLEDKSNRISDVFHSSEEISVSDEDFAVDSLSEEELEKLIEAIDEKKKLITTLKAKPWPMRKKLHVLRYIFLPLLYKKLLTLQNYTHTHKPYTKKTLHIQQF